MKPLPFFLLFFLLVRPSSLSASSDNTPLLKELDALLDNHTQFVHQREEKIRYLKQLATQEKSLPKVLDITYQLIEEYSGFQSDSAFLYIEKNHQLATGLGDTKQLRRNRFQYVFVCAQSGLLNEAQQKLDYLQADLFKMDNDEKVAYYKLQERLYMNLREFSGKSHLEKRYRSLELAYCDSIVQLSTPDTEEFYYYTFKKLYGSGQLSKARAAIESYNQLLNPVSNDAARGLYQLSLLYAQEGNLPEEERCLAASAIADVKSAVKQNRSLRLLGQLRYKQGDLKRAYRYIQFSLDDANFYNTRLRNSQLAEVIPIIQKDYQVQRDTQTFRLRLGIILVSIFFVVILGTMLYVRKKKKELLLARRELMTINDELNAINREMMQKNDDLQKLTDRLTESDQIKEQYVSYFLKLCSTYIQKISEYQKLVNRKIKSGQIDDLLKMNSSNQYLLKESKEFYNKFDEAFLHIYPHFVSEFNALLKEDQRFTLKEGELLNTELRIYALIRMGIRESSQIAEFMGYTPVTIYTYRTKVKSRAIHKESFDKDVLGL